MDKKVYRAFVYYENEKSGIIYLVAETTSDAIGKVLSHPGVMEVESIAREADTVLI